MNKLKYSLYISSDGKAYSTEISIYNDKSNDYSFIFEKKFYGIMRDDMTFICLFCAIVPDFTLMI